VKLLSQTGNYVAARLPPTGIRDAARELARKNLRALVLNDVDAIVTNVAGGGSTLKEYHHLFTPDKAEYGPAAVLAKNARCH
jgi:Fe-S oxidoreductase